MKEIKKDNKKRELERAEKEEKRQEDEARNDYLDNLKADDRFQKYVIEEIIKLEINNLTDLRNFGNNEFKDLKELGNLVLQSNLARKILERIFSKLI